MPENLFVSAFSRAKALITLMPLMFSCTRSDNREKVSCTTRKRTLICLPKPSATRASSGSGIRAIRVNFQSIVVSIRTTAIIVKNTESTSITIPMPMEARTALISFVPWAMRSPVLRWS